MANNKINVGGRLHSIATGNIIAGADEILDDNKSKKQSEINIDIDNALADRYTKDETYNKNELNSLITTPDVKYLSVTATDQTTAVTDVLPATGEADTVYRVGNWDGSQFNETVYSEYAWNGSQYVHLNTKTKIEEVFDISAYHATGGELAKYTNLDAALDSNNGGGVPQSFQNGGMSVKFVRTSDNKYIQARCMDQNFTTDVTKWQCVDDEPTSNSHNLVTSGGTMLEILKQRDNISEIVTDYPKKQFSVKEDGTFGNNSTYYHGALPVQAGDKFIIRRDNNVASMVLRYAFATSDECSADAQIPLVEDTSVVVLNPCVDAIIDIEQDCYFLFNSYDDVTLTRIIVYEDSLKDNSEKQIKNGKLKEYIENNTISSNSVNYSKQKRSYARNNIQASSIENKLHSFSQLETLDKVYLGTTIVNNIWQSNENGCVGLKKVNKNDILTINLVSISEIDRILGIWFLTTKPQLGDNVGEAIDTKIYNIEQDINFEFIAPANGYILLSYRKSLACVTINKTEEYDDLNTFVEEKLVFNTLPNSYLDCDEDSNTFGNVKPLEESSDYCVSEYIDVSDVRYIKLLSRWSNSVTIGQLNTGCVFYDNEHNPISVFNTIQLSYISGKVLFTYHAIPDNASFARVTIYNGSDVYILKDKIADTIEGLKEVKKEIDYAGITYYNGYVNASLQWKYSQVGKNNTAIIPVIPKQRLSIKTDIENSLVFLKTFSGAVEGNAVDISDEAPDRITCGTNYEMKVPSDSHYLVYSTYRGSVKTNAQIFKYVLLVANVSELNSKVSGLEEYVNQTKNDRSILELNPDGDIYQKMVAASRAARVSSGLAEISPLVIAHISDMHGSAVHLKRYLDFIKHWKDKGYIHEIIDTGDIVTSTYTDGTAWRESIEGIENVISVIGNHDTRASSAEKSAQDYPVGQNEWQYHSAISLDETKRTDAYNKFMVGPDANNPYIDNWDVIQPANASTKGLCYYYKDYADKNLRMIVLDVMGYNEEQNLWLQDRLADTLNSNNSAYGYHVFIACHFCGSLLTQLDCNYDSRTVFTTNISPTLDFNDYVPNIAIAVNSFQNNGGVFIGYISGHHHADFVRVLADYPKQLLFAVSSGGRTPLFDFIKVEGCKSYDDFQIVSIDTYSKIIKLIKIGADTDIYMRKKGILCASYTLVKDDGTEPSAGETATKVKGIIGEGW